MATCRQCIHSNICQLKVRNLVICDEFQDKSHVVEVPCRIGDNFYTRGNDGVVCHLCNEIHLSEKNIVLVTDKLETFTYGKDAFVI